MKFFALAVFAISAAVTCVWGATPDELAADAKGIAARVTELHSAVGHINASGADDSDIARLRFAARALFDDLKHGTVNVKATSTVSENFAATLVGIITPIETESVSTLEDLDAKRDLLLHYQREVFDFLQLLRQATEEFALAYLDIAPLFVKPTIELLNDGLAAAYSHSIQIYSA